ncbi:hypothetical protein DMUE_5724 [Dictyocoela muelleri]|nr:hypothetical protein DMUE_5724 [Dictyocoela muelleri]
MNIKKSDNYKLGSSWKCSRCKKRVNLLIDTILNNTKISPKVFLKFAFYFFEKQNFTRDYVMRNTKIGEEMYASILSIFRKKISNYVNQNRRKLVGILKEIQIDDTFWAKRK